MRTINYYSIIVTIILVITLYYTFKQESDYTTKLNYTNQILQSKDSNIVSLNSILVSNAKEIKDISEQNKYLSQSNKEYLKTITKNKAVLASFKTSITSTDSSYSINNNISLESRFDTLNEVLIVYDTTRDFTLNINDTLSNLSYSLTYNLINDSVSFNYKYKTDITYTQELINDTLIVTLKSDDDNLKFNDTIHVKIDNADKKLKRQNKILKASVIFLTILLLI